MNINDQLSKITNIASCAHVHQSEIGNWTEIGQRCRIENTEIGDYSYVQQDVDISLCSIGKFVSIAASVRINPSNHPWWRASQHHFTYRPSKYGFEEKRDQ
ncbi:LbetaH domain-containing protein [Alginatibacterium sediminis]|uniref:hypothetical protein n=1 Tax=Alginatibacterium sediminis TaxID=2164068 RepID=UPI001F1EC940|nr:hypothetical protein [Alginatibacterium sediminis]